MTGHNVGTGFERVTIPTEKGRYSLLSLPPGTYKVTVDMPGFSTVMQDNIELSVNQTIVLDF